MNCHERIDEPSVWYHVVSIFIDDCILLFVCRLTVEQVNFVVTEKKVLESSNTIGNVRHFAKKHLLSLHIPLSNAKLSYTRLEARLFDPFGR